MSDDEKILEYKVELDLNGGARLNMLMFSHNEHRWIFENRFVSPEKRRAGEKPVLINDTMLIVEYENGVARDCKLRMDIKRPDKMGEAFLAGMDISKGSKLNIEFEYKKQGDLYVMQSIDCSPGKRIDFDSQREGLVKAINFPFPVKDHIENEYGIYKVPFLKTCGEEAFFEFPGSYEK